MNSLNTTIQTSTKSMITYYREMIDVEKSCIYTSFLNDYYRKVITRWRLSCHKLKIETQRYSRPFVERSERKCDMCDVVEDEAHAVFACPLFESVREQFQYLLSNNTNIQSVLNPSRESMVDVSKLLYAIQDVIDDWWCGIQGIRECTMEIGGGGREHWGEGGWDQYYLKHCNVLEMSLVWLQM